MCQSCVDNGRMTQEELDKALADGDESVTPIIERLAAGTLGDEDATEVRDLLAQILGMAGQPDPEVDAMRQLDSVADKILAFLGEQAYTVSRPTETVALAQDLAGKLMFGIAPSSIAVALAVISLRYRDLLGAWADLYVDAHGLDQDPEKIDTLGEPTGVPTDEMVAAVDGVRESRAEKTQDLGNWSAADAATADHS